MNAFCTSQERIVFSHFELHENHKTNYKIYQTFRSNNAHGAVQKLASESDVFGYWNSQSVQIEWLYGTNKVNVAATRNMYLFQSERKLCSIISERFSNSFENDVESHKMTCGDKIEKHI